MTYREEQRVRKAQKFFGKGNFKKINREDFTYSVYGNPDEVIFLTEQVSFVQTGENTTSYVLPVSKHRGVYLRPWQVMPIQFWDGERFKRAFLVKLKRRYFHVYSFKTEDILSGSRGEEGFRGQETTVGEWSFNEFYEACRRQEEEKFIIRILA